MRGVANLDLTPEIAFALGRAGATILAAHHERERAFIVGRDTRCSGTMLEAALVAGITSTGRDAICVGIVPTPAVARIALAQGAAAGAMISASHNPIADNGIKFFGADGFKLADALEDEITAAMEREDLPRPIGAQVGVVHLAVNLGCHYYAALDEAGGDLAGMEVVVDGAFGAAYAMAPHALRKLGAHVHAINCENDGARINVNCGATHLQALQAAVRARHEAGHKRTLGVAFDGDADRALFVDEAGEIVDGDRILYILASDRRERGGVHGGRVVGTVMSNVGLERALHELGVGLERTAVGDRYVLERMRGEGLTLGGEPSGHIVDLERSTTGDGPLTAVLVLSILARSGVTLRELAAAVRSAPQVLVNVRVEGSGVLEQPTIREAIAAAQERLGAEGRILVRASGTEPLVRVMIQGDDQAAIEAMAGELAQRIGAAAATAGV